MDIDLNCDLGEGAPYDGELMPLITSANIACGFHAGDALLMRNSVFQAVQHGVRIGAHPGYNDREHFGRKDIPVPPEQVFAELTYQIGALIGIGHSLGATVSHVKPHGALYNRSARNAQIAEAVVEATAAFNIPLMGLSGSELEKMAARYRLPFYAEGFADRRYQPDGSLVSRSSPDAFVRDPKEAVIQARQLIEKRGVRTLCVHGDNPAALAFVRALRESLIADGFTIRPISAP
jgi:5-oxoprolinase (ATP-hydrolysing) subunit A